MRALFIFFIFSILSESIYSQSKLEAKCDQLNGTIVDEVLCPQSLKKREGKFCLLDKMDDGIVFFNGCTGVSSEYGRLFFDDCFKHDLCYHHEPSFSGKSKQKCDELFKADMMKTCERSGLGLRCRVIARAFERAVIYGGKKSWSCSDENIDYTIYLD